MMTDIFDANAVEETDEPRQGRRIGCGRIFLAALVALVVFAVSAFFLLGGAGTVIGAPDYPEGEAGEPVTVTIPEGATLTDIGAILEAEGVVESQRAFVRATRTHSSADGIAAGSYQLPTHIPADQAIEELLDPASRHAWTITLREGLTLQDQLDILAEETGLPREDFEAAAEQHEAIGLPDYAASAEGYLFPDTYTFEPDTEPTAMLSAMVDQFETMAADIGLEQAAQDQQLEPQELVTVASIVEAEVFNEGDREKVAQVIYNRLDQDMPLQMDSTVKYIHGMDGVVTTTDEERASDDPYNTYVHPGLPPGPIGAPGRAALEGAAHPEDGPWLYFVAVNMQTGETKFAETWAEHETNVAEFQQWCQANEGYC